MTRELTRDQVITLINKMRELNQTEQAKATYRLANETFPEWHLREAFEQMKVEPK